MLYEAPSGAEVILGADPLLIASVLEDELDPGTATAVVEVTDAQFEADCVLCGLAVRALVRPGGLRCAVVTAPAGPGSLLVETSCGSGSGAEAWAIVAPASDVSQAAQRASLMLGFARLLRRTRASFPHCVIRPPVVLDHEPDVDASGLLAFPHLMVVDRGRLADEIAWEVITRDALLELTGRTGFDLGYWRERLDALIELKAAVRVGTSLPVIADEMPGLERALRGRYLSFRFVLQHEQLLSAIVDKMPSGGSAIAQVAG